MSLSTGNTGLEHDRIEPIFQTLYLAVETADLLRSFRPSDPARHDQILFDLDAIIDRHTSELQRRSELSQDIAAIVLARRQC
jgi:hypothetical protein